MLLRFTKMHGLGNDFVVIDAVTQQVQMTAELARRLADRHFGIGCDQILIVEAPSLPDADFSYLIFNADGSEVAQCGNGARCLAKFVRDRQLTGKDRIRVQTRASILELGIEKNGEVSVAMGTPRLEPAEIPFQAPSRATLYTLDVDGQTLAIAAVALGNPHAILQVADIATAPVATLGPKIEGHPRFPEQVNAGFMAVIARDTIRLRVYERGAGETLACGSGACAAVVAGILQGLLDSSVTVHLPGGSLRISWPGEGQPVVMTGPATTVFQGRIKL
ncbi:MAG: diaminopimelate epimerase [Porticoccaceae bacterium]